MFSLKRRFFFLALLATVFALLFPAGCRQPLAPAQQLQEKVLAAHGGRNALQRVSSLVFTGVIETRRGDSGAVFLALTGSGALRTTMKYSKHFEDRILKGDRGWRDFGAGFEEVSGPSLAAMIFQYNHLFLPMGLLNDRYTTTYKETTSGGKTLPKVR